jgi:hypothetical protein
MDLFWRSWGSWVVSAISRNSAIRQGPLITSGAAAWPGLLGLGAAVV